MRKKIPRNKRVSFRFTPSYGASRPLEYKSFIADMSDTGLFMRTNRVYNPGTHIYMTIEIYKESYDCEGRLGGRNVCLPVLSVLQDAGRDSI